MDLTVALSLVLSSENLDVVSAEIDSCEGDFGLVDFNPHPNDESPEE